MVKKQLKCHRCGKLLLREYGKAILSVTCVCGYTMRVKDHTSNKEDKNLGR